jgi:sulfoxide reductase heme-binding subunit YedZ
MARPLESWRLVSALALAISIANGMVLPSVDLRSAHDTEVLILHSVLCALPFLLVAFTASSVATLWPSRATRWILSNRRYFGLAFAFAMAWHFAFVGYSTLVFGNHVGASDLTLDIIGLCFLIAMTLTSFRLFARRLIPADWRRLHRTGIHVLWFLPTYFYLEDYRDNHDLFYLGTGCVFLSALLIPGLAWAKRWVPLKYSSARDS